LRAEIKDNDSLMRHAKCHYYKRVSSFVVAINIIMSAALAAAGPADNSTARRIDALPLTKTWAQTMDGPAPLAAAAAPAYFVAGWADHLEVFLLESGAKAWSLPIPSAHVACDELFCVVAVDTAVRGIDLARRAVRWQQTLERPLSATPTLRSGWVLLAAANGVVSALQATDGKKVWSFDAGAALSGPASINGNQVAIATVSARVSLLNLMNGQPVWSVTLERQPGAPRLGGGSVMVGIEGGHLVILDDADGRARFQTRTGGNVTGAPALDEKHIYEVGQDGVLRAFDRGNGSQRWYGNLATRASDGPLVDGDLVLVPLRTGAVDVRLNDGKAAAQLPAPTTDRLRMAPIIAGGGSSLSVLTVSYNLADTSKWTLIRYAAAAPLALTARPAKIPGFALTLTPPQPPR
jgi:outer membrane protein assembly factor BamB